MEEQLKRLRKSMKKNTFHELNFNARLRENILHEIKEEEEAEEDIFLALMQLLVVEKSGYELISLLRSRGMKKFENNEGSLYMMLHRLEHTGYLQARWNNSNVKLYCLNNKGHRWLRKAEKSKHTDGMFIKKAPFLNVEF
ncbi:PadR family transcriptional regulator [Heyndrickxia vini]|uniref:PadR family transcriptional regulator n=1 Tax=Heyndrickxia vini TaxID=1476025 RepID=A0ABX7E4Z4_9BACI|nr:PadR family transcriptional regulator [Heyndrickxia vini]QQZ09882.1 PadR family transcriptional regulator [Heyndrickxia vini]